MAHRSVVNGAELMLGVALVAIAAAALWLVAWMPGAAGYSQVGPKVVPALAAGGLLITALVLLIESATGGFRYRAAEDVDPFDRHGLAWLAAGLTAHMVLIGLIGFVGAAMVLFVCAARGLGSRRLLRDLFVGLALAGTLYMLFTVILGLSLGPTFEVVLQRLF